MRALRRTLLLLALALPAAAAAAQQGAAVAVIVRLSGAVRVAPPGRAAPRAATVGMRVAAGERLVVPRGASAVLLYRSGRAETVTRDTRIAAPRDTAAPGVFRQTLRTLGEVSSTDARLQPNRQGMIRPLAGAAVPIEPRNEVAVVSERPRFVWFAIPGAGGYVLQFRHLGTGALRRFPVGRDTAWTPPDPDALERGARYEWSVAAVDGGRAAPPQRFRILSRAGLDSLEVRLAEVQAAGLSPDGDGLFLTALIYRDAGLLYHARTALDRLAATGGRAGRDVHLLRGEVYDGLGMLSHAEAEFRLAAASR
ncbi:MAG TPA: hypothetical protein VEW03_00865 [Longimicrobiaceae bacterium]|nr:hypothetical protein [Longimicrobiaceae bacterium]